MNRLLCWLFGHPAFGWTISGVISEHRVGKLDGLYYCVRCFWHEPVWLAQDAALQYGIARRIRKSLREAGW